MDSRVAIDAIIRLGAYQENCAGNGLPWQSLLSGILHEISKVKKGCQGAPLLPDALDLRRIALERPWAAAKRVCRQAGCPIPAGEKGSAGIAARDLSSPRRFAGFDDTILRDKAEPGNPSKV